MTLTVARFTIKIMMRRTGEGKWGEESNDNIDSVVRQGDSTTMILAQNIFRRGRKNGKYQEQEVGGGNFLWGKSSKTCIYRIRMNGMKSKE